MKLIDVIVKNVGDDVSTEQFVKNLGYDACTLNEDAIRIGTVADGINRADVYSLAFGGWHISTQTAEFYTDDDPAGDPSFRPA